MRNILSVLIIAVALFALEGTTGLVSAQELDSYSFSSTSTLTPSGSSLPQAAVTGVEITDPESSTDFQPSQQRVAKRRNVDEDEELAEPGIPLGEGVAILLSMLGGYAAVRRKRYKC